jgi:hypothetical protein
MLTRTPVITMIPTIIRTHTVIRRMDIGAADIIGVDTSADTADIVAVATTGVAAVIAAAVVSGAVAVPFAAVAVVAHVDVAAK